MYKITKDFHWSASHQLAGLPDGHQCGRLHGHNYIARVGVQTRNLDPVGFVVDFGELAFVQRYIDERWDHRHLNDVIDFNPTAENMACILACLVQATLDLPDATISVDISETPKAWASYTIGPQQ